MDEAINEMKRLCLDEKIIGLYDKEEEERRERNCQLRYAKNQGIVQGKLEGKAEGIDIGMRQKEIEMAKKMLSEDLPIDVIMRITNLTKEQIEELK